MHRIQGATEVQELYKKISQLMGKPSNHELFRELVEIAGEPVVYVDAKYSTEYMFCNGGFSLSYFKNPQCFAASYLYLNELKFKRLFRGVLPTGMLPGDDPAAIQRKIALSPTSTQVLLSDSFVTGRLEVVYNIEPLMVTFLFFAKPDSSGVTTYTSLSLISFRYKYAEVLSVAECGLS